MVQDVQKIYTGMFCLILVRRDTDVAMNVRKREKRWKGDEKSEDNGLIGETKITAHTLVIVTVTTGIDRPAAAVTTREKKREAQVGGEGIRPEGMERDLVGIGGHLIAHNVLLTETLRRKINMRVASMCSTSL